LTGLECSPIT